MSFWDSSAIVPLLVAQAISRRAEEYYQSEEHGLTVWWGTVVECVSAISRLEKSDELSNREADKALKNLMQLAKRWHEILPSDQVRDRASRLLRLHPLRTGDAFQLGAAIVASEDFSSKVRFITFDQRLALAARKEGFEVLE